MFPFSQDGKSAVVPSLIFRKIGAHWRATLPRTSARSAHRTNFVLFLLSLSVNERKSDAGLNSVTQSDSRGDWLRAPIQWPERFPESPNRQDWSVRRIPHSEKQDFSGTILGSHVCSEIETVSPVKLGCLCVRWPRSILSTTNMRRDVFSFALSFMIVCLCNPGTCHAQWTKDIDCPAGTVYRDLRPDAGRQEFCERLLPGSLRVKDGPFRFWFSQGYPGDEGVYKDGREVGPWKECGRFGKCKRVVHELTFSYERERPGFRREIPVSFQQGKYVFDFKSCWSTWITQTGGEDLNLNIGGTPYQCNITYTPQHVLEHGGEGGYFCRIPFSVGKKELDSLDLLHELPKLGLPQFCRTIGPTGEDFALLENFMDVATAVDVQTAVMTRDNAGHELVVFRLNQFATDLAVEVATKQGPLTTRICSKYDQQTEISRDASGRTSFKFRLSDDHVKANEQRKCVAKLIGPRSPIH
jgi:hypothetical protein